MLTSSFSWVHVVRGRPRHPASQGCVERSHSPYKKAILAKLKEHNTEDWVHWMHVVQCEVNNRPNRSRGDLSPYSLYFNQTNKLSYADLLVPVHKEAETEYRLRLARMVLDKVKELDPVTVMTADEVRFLIRCGDSFFTEASLNSKEENVSHSLIAEAAKCIRYFHYEIEERELVETDGDEVEEPIVEEEPQPMEATNDTARDVDGNHEAMHDEEVHERIRNGEGNTDPTTRDGDGNTVPRNDEEEHELRKNGDGNTDPRNDEQEHELTRSAEGNPDPMNDKEEQKSLNDEEEHGSAEEDNAQEQEEVAKNTAQAKSKEQEEDAESRAQGNSQDEEDAQEEVAKTTAQAKSKEPEEDAESRAQGNSQDEEDAQQENDAKKINKCATKAPRCPSYKRVCNILYIGISPKELIEN
jgi:hypothetical protein